MTDRLTIAAMAMQGILANASVKTEFMPSSNVAERAIKFADALIAEEAETFRVNPKDLSEWVHEKLGIDTTGPNIMDRKHISE